MLKLGGGGAGGGGIAPEKSNRATLIDKNLPLCFLTVGHFRGGTKNSPIQNEARAKYFMKNMRLF